MMKRLLFLMMSVLCIVSCTKDPEVLTGEIKGFVTDAEYAGTEPLSGVKVTIGTVGSTVTGFDGLFSFTDLEAGTYKLQFSKDGYKTDTRNVQVLAAQVINCDVQMKKEKRDNLEFSNTVLDFGTLATEISMTITNKGMVDLEWALDLGKNTDWLSASPLLGRLSAEKTQTIVFTLDRSHLEGRKSAVVNLRAGGSSFPISISASAKEYKAKMLLEPTSIDFGETGKEQSLKIKNIGDAPLDWTIKNIGSDYLSVSEQKGNIAVDGSKVVTVKLNRDLMEGDLSTSMVVSDGINEEIVKVTAKYVAQKSELVVTPNVLDFEGDKTLLPLAIKNAGNTDMSWSITGLPPYLTVSSQGGSLRPDASTEIYVQLNREQIPETLNISFAVTDGQTEKQVLVKAYTAKPEMTISPKALNFGKEQVAQSFRIYNTGHADLSWRVKSISHEALSLSAESGRLSPMGDIDVTVNLDRHAMPAMLDAEIVLTDGVKEEVVTVTAEKDDRAVVSQGLYTYYKFEDNFDDSSTNMIHGFGKGNPAPAFVEGVVPGTKAIQFSKTADNSFIVGKPIIDSREMTISFWGKDFEDGNIFYAVSKHGNEPIFNLFMEKGYLKFFARRDNDIQRHPAFSHPSLTDGKWHHIVILSDLYVTSSNSITHKLYVDGQLIDQVSESEFGWIGTYGTGLKFVMGGKTKNGSIDLKATNMSVDNFRVYDTRHLSDDEIKQIYNAKE